MSWKVSRKYCKNALLQYCEDTFNSIGLKCSQGQYWKHLEKYHENHHEFVLLFRILFKTVLNCAPDPRTPCASMKKKTRQRYPGAVGIASRGSGPFVLQLQMRSWKIPLPPSLHVSSSNPPGCRFKTIDWLHLSYLVLFSCSIWLRVFNLTHIFTGMTWHIDQQDVMMQT